MVSSRPRAQAYRVGPVDDEVVETPLQVTYLGAPAWPSRPPRERRHANDLRHGRGRLHDGARQPRAGRLRALARRRARAADPLPAHRVGRPDGADHRLPRALRRPRVPAPSTCRCSGCTGATRTLREIVLEQHIVYCGGGSMRNLLAIWRAHGLDAMLRRGMGARGRARRAERGGDVLVRGRHHALLGAGRRRSPGSASCRARSRVHADGEPERLPVYLDAVRTRRAARRLGGRRRRRPALLRLDARARRVVAAGRRRLPGRRGRGRAGAAGGSSPSCWAAAPARHAARRARTIEELRQLQRLRRGRH